MRAEPETLDHHGRHGPILEVFVAFLRLGLTSFGGPVAHLGYFRNELVLRRKWIDEAGYADLVALCQFLPGPASSQVGFSLGVLRGGGLLGGIVAWCGFTLPSAALLLTFAIGAASFDLAWEKGILHGLKLVAVAVVAQAVWGMARTLAPDRPRAGIALAAVLLVTFAGGRWGRWPRSSSGPRSDLPCVGRRDRCLKDTCPSPYVPSQASPPLSCSDCWGCCHLCSIWWRATRA